MRLHYSSMRVAFKADAVRAKVSRDLGFSREDRVVHGRRPVDPAVRARRPCATNP
jgi:adenylylsulfate kinase-like enzyme